MDLEDFIKLFSSNYEEGKVLYKIFDIYKVYYKGEKVRTGTLRYNSRILSHILGGSYLDYYCSESDKNLYEKIIKKMKKSGVELK